MVRERGQRSGLRRSANLPGGSNLFPSRVFKKPTNGDPVESMVRERGLDPPRLAALAPQTSVSTIPPLARNFNYTGFLEIIISARMLYPICKGA